MSGSLLNRSMVRREFQPAIETALVSNRVNDLCLKTNSTSAVERYGWFGQTPKAVERLGPLELKALVGKTLDVTNKKWNSAVSLDYDDMRRDQTGTATLRIGELADSVALKPWEILANLIKNGDVAGNVAYDGLKFFDTVHTEGDSGTQKNDITATEVPTADIATSTAPTPEEAALFLLDTISYMQNLVDDAGRPMNMNARKFGVVYPLRTTWHGAVVTAITANQLASGRTNPLKEVGYELIPIPVPTSMLDWTAEFAVFRLDGRTRPFILQEEVAPQLFYFDEDSDYFKINRAYGVSCDWLGNVAYGQWQHAVKVLCS